jgi:hypothetical protein
MASRRTESLSRLAGFLLLAATPALAATYRWVDDQGKVHYGDVMPSQQPGKGGSELDKQGRVVKDLPRTPTGEERRRLEDSRLQREEAQRQEETQRRKDRALLNTYVSEQEIDLARDRALAQEEANLKGLKTRLNVVTGRLAQANAQVAQVGRGGRPPDASLIKMRDAAQADVAKIGDLIRQREQAVEEIRVRYEADKLRFRELKANPAR